MKKRHTFLGGLTALLLIFAFSAGIFGAEMGRPFNDVPKNEWYYNYVYNAYAQQMFKGTADNLFSPKQATNRAMLVTVLYRMTAPQEKSAAAPYTDIAAGSYYQEAVNWAWENKVVEGFPDNTFGPETAVSREQMIKILYGYYTNILKQTPQNSGSDSGFADSATVSDWAKVPMAWAIGNSVINGRTPTTLCPAETSERCEVATLLMRFRTGFMGDSLTDYKSATISDGTIAAQSNNRMDYWFGTNYDSSNRPAEPQRMQNAYGNAYNVLSIGNGDQRTIYLTFDEGYENGYTPAILDTLKAKGVKAVFFVTYDFAKDNPALIQRMINEGHVVGNHSTKHPAKGMPSLGLNGARDDMENLQNYMRYHYDYEMTLFRFPAGIYSDLTLQLVNSLHMKSVFWSFAYGDYNVNAQPGQSASLTKLTNRLHPGAVYLLHAVSSTNTAILGSFIDNARSQGYSFSLIVNH